MLLVINTSAIPGQAVLNIVDKAPSDEVRLELVKHGVSVITKYEFDFVANDDRRANVGLTGYTHWVGKFAPFFLNVAIEYIDEGCGVAQSNWVFTPEFREQMKISEI
jgi:hypothetical protein